MARRPRMADVAVDAGGGLRARDLDDVYFSKDGGLEEARAVFLDGCGLPESWRDRRRFVIGELGFGSGLNALAAWRAWRETRPDDAILHFQSVEGRPLGVAQARSALAAFPDIAIEAEALLRRWPAAAFGPQRLWFPEDRFALTVWIGEASEALAAMQGPVDAWFLDGFAPARNPAMWSDAAFAEIARLSAPDARAASDSAARVVRDRLAAAGFAVAKKPGFGAKRDRIEARRGGAPTVDAAGRPRVAILGAGIAGACAAAALCARGVRPIVFDANGPAAGASGNPAGLVTPRLDRGDTAAAAFLRAAYFAALDLYATAAPDAFDPIGADHFPDSPRARAAFMDLLADPPLPDDHLAAAPNGGLRYRRAGVLRPAQAVAALLAGAELRVGVEVAGLRAEAGGWTLLRRDGSSCAEADAVVIATGAAAPRFAPLRWLPIALSRGQVEAAPVRSPPSRAAMRGSYFAPVDGTVVFGATFDPAPQDAPPPNASDASRAANLAALAALAPELAQRMDPEALRSRAALRATTPDRLPVAGAVPDAAAWTHPGADVFLPGLFVIGGLGARGLTTAPLLGEAVACAILREPAPLSAAMAGAVSPARFLDRALRRGPSAPSEETGHA